MSSFRNAPYRHADGSNCWTKNCSRNIARVPSITEFFNRPDIPAESAPVERKPVLNTQQVRLVQVIEEFEVVTGKKVAFGTVHGSHLYGMSHAGSDEDFYLVTFPQSQHYNKTEQTIVNGIDTVSVNIKHFVELANTGSHQALEAMFSNQSVGDDLKPYRDNFHVGTNIYNIYEETVRKFALSDNFKRKRHALRLVHNLNEMIETGRFNPTLSPEIVDDISKKTNATADEYFTYLNNVSRMELRWNNKN